MSIKRFVLSLSKDGRAHRLLRLLSVRQPFQVDESRFRQQAAVMIAPPRIVGAIGIEVLVGQGTVCLLGFVDEAEDFLGHPLRLLGQCQHACVPVQPN